MKLFVLMTITLNLVAMHIIEDAGEDIVNVRGCLCHVIVMYSGNDDCQWGNWVQKTDCSKTCGGGTFSLKRIIVRNNSGNGLPCSGEDTRVEACNNFICPDVVAFTIAWLLLLSSAVVTFLCYRIKYPRPFVSTLPS